MGREQRGLQVIQRLGQTYRAMQAGFSGRVGHALPRWRILFTLAEDGASAQKQLVERCRLDPASLTRLLQALEQQEWIARETDVQDNRQTRVSLTPAGQAVVDAAMPRRLAFFDEALDGLQERDLDVLLRVLGALEENFRKAGTAQAPDRRA
nr:MarR family transcriptional regulator [Pigmentiphaga humi]